MGQKIDKDLQRFRKIVRGKVKSSLSKYISRGEMIGKKGNDLVSIDRAEAFGHNPSVDVAAPSQIHRILKLATGTPQTLDKYRPGEAQQGAKEAQAFTLDPAHAKDNAS